jgi:Zn-dependent protease with chaperone function
MTMYWLSAAAITLSCFAIVAMLTSGAIAWAAPALARRLERYAPAVRARLLFRLRVLPATSAAVCAFGIALPIFLRFEPVETGETLARTLIVAAVLGGALIVRGAWRAAAGLRATGAVLRDWRARGRRVETGVSDGAPIPVFAIDDAFPTVAVVGFSRPALFIAERVLRECTRDEVRAMLLHECAHVTHRDNLKRFFIRACPDVLGRTSALDRAWASASEEAADARAAGGDLGSALELAQALIHIARLAPGSSTLHVASAFYLGGSIEARVRRLVEPADSLLESAISYQLSAFSYVACAMALGLVGLVVFAAPAIHQFMEAAVRVLP